MSPLLRRAVALIALTLSAKAAAQMPRPSEIMPRATQSTTSAVINNGKHLITVGDRGQILASNDGLKWAQVAVPVRSMLTALSFADDQTGWAVGDDATILKTEDGGKSWMLQNFEPEKETAFLSVVAIDANHALAAGAVGLLYATRDGGLSWNEVVAPAIREPELFLHAIVRLNDGSLFVAGESGMLGVGSAGKWQRLKSPYDGSLFGALPRGKKGALIFGLRGQAYVSDDVRGNRWSRVALGSDAGLYGGVMLADGRAVLVGAGGAVFVVDAAGKRAEPIASGVTGTLCGVAPVSGGLVVVGDDGVHHINTALVAPARP
ncbi:WD40/YVTN/BNR-like repeat-containing protein [Hydrocarboniphaga sp.]|uniref:WD40/YVTN/BNR-like repeat-containing protein n=1 Tax=Hydrocarboniphaga sp. TaxID=2033016 RepID=UPI003D0E3C40